MSALLALLLLTACGAPYHQVAQRYLVNGNTAIGLEYLDAGVRAGEGAKTRQLLVRTLQTYSRDLRREIDDLREAKQAYRALSKVRMLEDATRRGEKVGVPGASLVTLRKDIDQLQRQAKRQLEANLDERLGRGVFLRSDLGTCRKLQSLQGSDGSAGRTCQRLREHFMRYATLHQGSGTLAMGEPWWRTLKAALQQRHPELLALVDQRDDRRNARLIVYIERPEQDDTGWYRARRRVIRKAIKLRNRRGKLLKEIVEVPPSQAAVRRAIKAGKEPPGPTKKVKQLYRHVQGEVFEMARSQDVRLGYSVTLLDLRAGTLPINITGRVSAGAKASFQRYQGDREADPRGVLGRRRGRSDAERKLPGVQALTRGLLAQLPARIVDQTLRRIE
jgi:hypothetical protein